ncbi:MAG: hypothetical protein ACE15C_17790 [Phycisphaerae bacterium]
MAKLVTISIIAAAIGVLMAVIGHVEVRLLSGGTYAGATPPDDGALLRLAGIILALCGAAGTVAFSGWRKLRD